MGALFAMQLIMSFATCVCRSFLVSLCMFTVSEALLMSMATVIVRAGGVIRGNPLAIVLLMLCGATIVEELFVFM